jgi:glycosyltransferase involved in cell wall biosynthesis
VRVCRILSRPNLGGPTRQVAALFAAQRELGAQTLLLVGRCRPGERALPAGALGVPELDLRAALALGPRAEGWVEVPELGPGLHPMRDLRAGRSLRALLAAFAPDVVHTHTSKAGLLGRPAARKLRVPVVAHTFHGHVLRDYFGAAVSWLLARLERRLAARTDVLCAVSPSCAEELAALGVAPLDRIAVVPPALALPAAPPGARAAARARLGMQSDGWFAACAGRLVPIKRVDRFLDAAAILPELQGHVFGDGPLHGGLAARRPPGVSFRGAAPDLPALLAAYDALVIPSAREGCPLVALEAFAAGVPVVGFDVPGVRDALGPWGGGVLVPEAEGAAGLARALLALRSDPDLRRRCVEAGRSGLERFAPAAVAADLLARYARARSAPG